MGGLALGAAHGAHGHGQFVIAKLLLLPVPGEPRTLTPLSSAALEKNFLDKKQHGKLRKADKPWLGKTELQISVVPVTCIMNWLQRLKVSRDV